MQVLEQVFGSLQQVWAWLLAQGQFLTGWTQQQVQWFFVVFGVYIVVFFCFVPSHRFLKKKKGGLEQALTQQVDEMLYLLAKAQYFRHLDKRALGGDPHLALMKSIFTQGNCDYLQSSALILANVHKVEQLLGEKIIAAEQELAFLKQMKKWRLISAFEVFFRRMLGLFTLGGYLLFV